MTSYLTKISLVEMRAPGVRELLVYYRLTLVVEAPAIFRSLTGLNLGDAGNRGCLKYSRFDDEGLLAICPASVPLFVAGNKKAARGRG
jgi:hypothetical protein